MSKLLSVLLGVAFGAIALGASAQSTPAAGSVSTATSSAPTAGSPKVIKKSVKKAKGHHHKTAAVKAKAAK